MTERQHPLDHPDFDRTRVHAIWYLAHPLAPDEHYTFQQNMDHVVHMMRLCYDLGYYVVAPYHTICLALDDTNLEHRRIGLEVDCNLVRKLDGIILVGHKISSGMQQELLVAREYGKRVLDFTGRGDYSIEHLLGKPA